MAIDPRKFIQNSTVQNFKEKRGLCGRSSIVNTNNKTNFIKEIGKFGGFEGLNVVGLSKVAKGLRDLVSISEGTKTGRAVSKLFTSTTDDNGANSVLSVMGIEPRTVDQLKNFNVVAANQGLADARLLYQKVKNGELKLDDLPTTIGTFEQLFEHVGRIFTNDNASSQLDHTCEPTPYALNLMLEHGPKYKFLFVVEFRFNPTFANLMQIGEQTAFLVKYSDRPSINFEYDEVNMYNFRTRVLKRTIYNPVTMKFYDGGDNSANKLYEAYLKAMSPIANLHIGKGYEERGMDFSRLNSAGIANINNAGHQYSASMGPLAGDEKTILESIILYHVYDYGRKTNTFQMYNPKITELTLDEVDMSASAVNEMTIKFEYDGLFMGTDVQNQNNTDVFLRNNIFDGVGSLNGTVKQIEQQSSEIFDQVTKSGAKTVESAGGIINIVDAGANEFKNFF